MVFFAGAAAVVEALLLPLLLGFFIKVIFVIFAVLLKLLLIGLTSFGTSGFSVLLAILAAKSNTLSDGIGQIFLDPYQPYIYRRIDKILKRKIYLGPSN